VRYLDCASLDGEHGAGGFFRHPIRLSPSRGQWGGMANADMATPRSER
jgi:hypothetical protein